MDSYHVSIDGDEIWIGVEVKNHGAGNGNGLMVDIKGANTDWLGTSTWRRRSVLLEEGMREYPVTWCYHTGDSENLPGDPWYYPGTQDYFDGQAQNDGWMPVQSGVIGDIGYIPADKIEIVAGFPPGNIDNGSNKGGGMILRRVEGENLAYDRPGEVQYLTDGDLYRGYTFTLEPLGQTRFVDLEEIRRINCMALFSGDENLDTWDTTSVRGYAVEISLDNFRYEEVGVLNEIGISNADRGGYGWYDVRFPEEWARYSRFKITQPRVAYPNIGEMMVYGVGYAYEGVYESAWIDFGLPDALKTLTNIQWNGDVPGGTNIIIQTQTRRMNGDDEYVTSDWSNPSSDMAFDVVVLEPAHEIRYRVRLTTQDIDVSPAFERITLIYTKDTTIADTPDELPEALAITGMYPNPFNGAMTVEYVLPSTGDAVIEVYNLAGQRVYRHDLGSIRAGRGEFVWNGRDSAGSVVSAGTYIIRLTAGDAIVNAKAMYLK